MKFALFLGCTIPLKNPHLEKAFRDGRLYEAGELELDTTGKETTFECWIEQIFKK